MTLIKKVSEIANKKQIEKNYEIKLLINICEKKQLLFSNQIKNKADKQRRMLVYETRSITYSFGKVKLHINKF